MKGSHGSMTVLHRPTASWEEVQKHTILQWWEVGLKKAAIPEDLDKRNGGAEGRGSYLLDIWAGAE